MNQNQNQNQYNNQQNQMPPQHTGAPMNPPQMPGAPMNQPQMPNHQIGGFNPDQIREEMNSNGIQDMLNAELNDIYKTSMPQMGGLQMPDIKQKVGNIPQNPFLNNGVSNG